MTPEFIEDAFRTEAQRLINRAELYESWDEYREERGALLAAFDATQMAKLRHMYDVHHSVEGYLR